MAESKTSKARKVVRSGSESVPTFYVNNVELRAMQWDFRLSMGEVVEVTDDELHVKDLVQIFMSPQHAKVFAGLIANQVKKYEDAIGPITLQSESEDE